MTTETKNLAKKPAEDVQELAENSTIAPRVDIYENEAEYLIVADLPGVKKDALDIQLNKDELTISGPRQMPDSGTLIAGPGDAPDFRRVFRVPDTLDASKVSAELERGVLRVHLPKSEAIRPRKIAISA